MDERSAAHSSSSSITEAPCDWGVEDAQEARDIQQAVAASLAAAAGGSADGAPGAAACCASSTGAGFTSPSQSRRGRGDAGFSPGSQKKRRKMDTRSGDGNGAGAGAAAPAAAAGVQSNGMRRDVVSRGNDGSATARSPIEGEEEGRPSKRLLLDSEFFWVESDWLRQWVTGECLPPAADSSGDIRVSSTPLAVSNSTEACSGKGTSDGVLPVMGVSDANHPSSGSRPQEQLALPRQGCAENDPGVVSGGGESRSCEKGNAKERTTVESQHAGDAADAQSKMNGGAAPPGETPKIEKPPAARAARGCSIPVMPSFEIDDDFKCAKMRPIGGKMLELVAKNQGDDGGGGDTLMHRDSRCEKENTTTAGKAGNDEKLPTVVKPPEVLASEKGPSAPPRQGASKAASETSSTNNGSCVAEGGVFREAMHHAPLMCEHGGLNPTSVARLKLVTRRVYEGLLGEDGMPPADRHLAAANFRCEQCVKKHIGQK